MRTSLFCHLDDIAAALDKTSLRKRGLTALTANVLYHDWVCFAPMSRSTPLRRESGGASSIPVRHRHPDMLRLVERPAALSVMKEARGAGLSLDAWTVTLHRDDLARAHGAAEDAALPSSGLLFTDAFGSVCPWWICPSSNEAAAYLDAHLADIAAAGFTRIVIEGCHYPLLQHGSAHERDLSRFAPSLRGLLEICFCPACLSRVSAEGIDAEAWRADVRAAVCSKASTIGHDPRLALTAAIRRRRITELFTHLSATHPGVALVCADQPSIAGSVFRTGMPSGEDHKDIARRVGFDLPALAAAGITIMCLAYFRSSDDVVAHVSSYIDTGIPAEMLSVALRPGHPDCADAAGLIAKVRAVRALGIQDVAFYELTQLEAGELERALLAIEAIAE